MSTRLESRSGTNVMDASLTAMPKGMLDMAEITRVIRETGLGVVGAFHAKAEDGVPEEIRTILLLGPEDAAMWEAFQAAPESGDGAPHPLDRWSRRMIDALAAQLSADAFYPFGGPPWHPFQRWAALGEGAVPSPVSMQTTEKRGLFASYRGALGFRERIAIPAPGSNPCLDCPAPCLTACPVNAFSGGRYDVPACVAHVNSPAGAACREGCLVRSACPAGKPMALPAAQRAFHMVAFLRAQGAG